MQISRRDALLGATAAAVVTTAATVPVAIRAAGVKAVLAGDPAIGLSDQLRATWTAWCSAMNAHEDACHRAGFNTLEGHKADRALGIEPLWQEREHWKARFWELQARLLDTPATTTRGVLAKIRGFYGDGEIAQIMAGEEPDPLPGDYVVSIYLDLERLAGEARS